MCSSKYKTLSDVRFKEHQISKSSREALSKIPMELAGTREFIQKQIGSTHGIIKFDNGIVLSILFGKMFYSNGVDTYEVSANIDNGEVLTKDNITEDELNMFMRQLQDLKVKI